MDKEAFTSAEIEAIWNDLGKIYVDLPEKKCSINSISQFINILNQFNGKNDIAFLELACGSGILAEYIIKNHIDRFKKLTFFDISDFMIEQTTKRMKFAIDNPKLVIKKENCEYLDYIEKDSLDMVMGNLLIHLVENPNNLMKCASKYLKSQGYLFLSILQPLEACTFMKLVKDLIPRYSNQKSNKRSYFYFAEDKLMDKLAKEYDFTIVERSKVDIDYKENEEQLLNLYKDFLKFEKYPEKIGSDNFDNLIKDVHQEIKRYEKENKMIGIGIENFVLKKN